MADSGWFQRDSQRSEGLSINLELSSNNPFRNRAASPASPFDDPPPRPLSRNPFLDMPPQPVRSPGAMSSNSEKTKSLSAEEIFNSLTLEDDMALKPPMRPAPALPIAVDGAKEEPEGERRPRQAGSQDEAMRARRMPPPGVRQGPSGSPHRRPPPPQRRPRRNSESSVADFDSVPLTEEEKRMIARRRERERQRRAEAEGRPPREPRDAAEGSERRERREPREPREPRERRDPNQRSRSGRPNKRVDIIDQLDATSIFGTGLFHHDGPFDALNAHRNREGRRAPMQAFPEGSLNNSLGGPGPVNRQADHSSFLGQHGDEAFTDYSYKPVESRHEEPQLFDPMARGEIVHGDQSEGLGTSTFLEGTPAARTAITRTLEEQARDQAENGLQRKKSLAQRIRHINKGPKEYPSGRTTNPEMPSAGSAEGNPFFAEYGKGEEKMTVRSREGAMSPTSPPRRGSTAALERRATADGALPSEENSRPSGFLGRMKSFKGGRRPRHNNADSGPASPPAQPGTAIWLKNTSGDAATHERPPLEEIAGGVERSEVESETKKGHKKGYSAPESGTGSLSYLGSDSSLGSSTALSWKAGQGAGRILGVENQRGCLLAPLVELDENTSTRAL